MLPIFRNDPNFTTPATVSLRQALQVFKSPYLGGVLIAFFVVTGIWEAGFDAQLYYLRYPPDNATTPIWVYLLTYPLSLLGWPMSWRVLAIATVGFAALFYALRDNRRWWLVVLSAPMVYNAWWGQIEIFTLFGLGLALVALEKKIHPAWLGIAWLLLAIKIQTNYGLLLLLFYWAWRKLGLRALISGLLICLGVFGLTLIVFPGWLERLFGVYRTVWFGDANASLFPYGLLAWPIALIPIGIEPERRIRMVACASLLSTPYFTLHHCLALLVLTDTPLALLLSWIPISMIGVTRDWAMYASIMPLGILALDLIAVWRNRRGQSAVIVGK